MRGLNIFRELHRKLRVGLKSRHLNQETESYKSKFLSRGLSVPSEAEIRTRLSNRLAGRKPRAKGDLHVLAIYHSYNWEGSSFESSLAAFGKVMHLDWRDPALAGGRQPGDAGWREAMNKGLLQAASAAAAKRPFDVVFAYLSGEQVDGDVLQELRKLGAPMVNLALNDKETFVGRVRKGHAAGARDICRHFDLCWTSTEDALEKYVVEGATPIYLPEGANPAVHKPYDENKLYDISFVGQCYGNRPGTISKLREAGIRIEAFGPGWTNGSLTMEEMVRTWARSRINLGFGGVLGHKETYCLKGRDFEVPMSGGLYLTEHHDELVQFYEIGREIVTYSGFDDLVEKIHWLLATPAAAEDIRRAGRERALREHTWEMRFEKVFSLMGALQ